jgi:hypothetical protein
MAKKTNSLPKDPSRCNMFLKCINTIAFDLVSDAKPFWVMKERASQLAAAYAVPVEFVEGYLWASLVAAARIR